MDVDKTWPGLYRGVCVDPTDTEGLGRVKVVVPQVTGPNAVMTAWPCKPAPVGYAIIPFGVKAPIIYGTPTVKAGQGVWVMYEGGHPDKPVWIGVF